ncbi:murein biosynthesis integral membrane protein MurJ [Ensifer soli]|uniref:murein biosynthesis integral membrane protein MurJ n=1 Tax=Ciceribacter sp. sgz301302 TaxID=3342379 RepID=UPI0035B8CD67
MSLVRKFMTVGGATLGSRLLGFGRETLMAAALGTGPYADAFYAAFRFPNLFRRLFAEGAFNAAFVPLFAREIEANGHDGAKRFSEEVFGVLFSVLLILTILMELAMPLLVMTIIAPGFAGDPEKYDVTVALSRVMFPYLACMSLTAMLSGMLNSLQHYFAAAVAPVFLNLVLIGALGYGLWTGADPLQTAWYLSFGVLAAGLLQMAVLYAGVRQAGMSIGFRRPRMTPNVKRLLWLALPAAATGGITQINQIIGQMIASTKDGAIAALQYADRIYQLPLGVVGIAVGVVLLPELARTLRAGHVREAENLQNRSMEFVLFLTLPAAGALWVISDEIVRVLYERGAFGVETTAVVGGTLAIYGMGLPAFVAIKALNPGFFAREDTRTPMVITGLSVAVNCVLAVTLFPLFAERGIATAEAASGWLTAIALFVMLVKRGHWQWEAALAGRVARMLAVTVAMAFALQYASGRLSGWLTPEASLVTQLAALMALIGGAMVFYFGLCFLTGAADARMLRRNLKRKARPAEPADPAAGA